jgi:hypothetical protein
VWICSTQLVSYISTTRPGARRGGGAWIAINRSRFSVSKPFEIVSALRRPIESTGDVTNIILYSRKINLLIDHISVTYNALKIQNPTASTMICGDRDSLDENKIIALDPNFKQILNLNTRKDNRLYMIIMLAPMGVLRQAGPSGRPPINGSGNCPLCS